MMSRADENDRNPRQNQRPQPAPSHSIFSVPTPIKQLFDRFPLLTYPVNELPQRAPRDRSAHVLYIFTSGEGARNGVPSYNPGCLKWQVCNISMPKKHSDSPFLGIPQVLAHRLPHSVGKQSCISQWRTALHNPCLTRAVQTHTTCTVRKAAKMGYEQQQGCHRGARRLAI
jgi:hypothetical protein